jgi:hypothetical protein
LTEEATLITNFKDPPSRSDCTVQEDGVISENGMENEVENEEWRLLGCYAVWLL